MAVKLSPLFNDQTFASAGAFAVGYKLFTYAAGSSTKQATYTDSTGNTPQSNPIIIGSNGYPPSPIWETAGQAYKYVLAPPTDTDPPTSPVKTIDSISGVNDSSQTTTQWVSSGVTPTYINATTFTLAGDQTTDFHVGRKAQFTTTAGTVYGELATSVYSTLTTVTVALDTGQVLDSGLSAVNLSILRNDHLATPRGASNPINYFVNGGCQVAQIAAATLSTTAQYGAVDNVMAWASTGAVSAGTISQNTASGIGTTGNSFKLAGVTLTGSAVLSVRIRAESKDAVKLKSIASSVAALVSHDVGSSINYTVIVRKPTVADNYTATTVISTSAAISVPTGISSATWLKFENIAMGDCSNGIEVEFQIACGAITTKNFEFTEFQIGRGATAVAIPLKTYSQELSDCQRYLPVVQSDSTSYLVGTGNAFAAGSAMCSYKYPVQPRVKPTGVTVSSATHFGVSDQSFGTVIAATAITLYAGTSREIAALNVMVAAGLVAGSGTFLHAISASGKLTFDGCRL